MLHRGSLPSCGLIRIATEAHPLLREYSTATEFAVESGGFALQYRTTNRLGRSPDWDIVLQKTGYIADAGRCLVMKAMIEGRSVIMVFLESTEKFSRGADANRMRAWLEKVKFRNRHGVARRTRAAR